jgi:hypothetical protein
MSQTPREADYADRRAHPRRQANCVVRCRLLSDPAAAPIAGRLVNVSQSGACMSIAAETAAGARIELEFVGRGINVAGQIQWVSAAGGGWWTLGCKFEEILSQPQLARICM